MDPKTQCPPHMCVRRLVGYSNTQKEPGEWDLYMIRRCDKCGHKEIVPIHWVNQNYPTCMNCMGQELAIRNDLSGIEWVMCTKCGGKHHIVLRDMRDAGL